MGKGDKKTFRGKIIMGSYGVTRKRNKSISKVKVTDKPKEVKKTTISIEKEKIVIEPQVKVIDLPKEVIKPVIPETKEKLTVEPANIEVEKKEKPKKEPVKKEKVKDVPVVEDKEKKTTKKPASKKKEE